MRWAPVRWALLSRERQVARAARRFRRDVVSDRHALQIAAFSAIVAALVSGAALINRAHWTERYPTARLLERYEQFARPAVRDERGELLGFLPPNDGADIEQMTVRSDERVPQHCLAMLRYREDRHAGTWRDIGAVDIGGVLRAITLRRGGSTLSMQVARLLAPEMRSRPLVVRKLFEWGTAGAVRAAFGGQDGVERAYLDLVTIGLAHGEIRGVAAAADIVFNRRVSQLTAAQCALFIVALPQPLLLGGTTEADKRWRSRREQAIRLLGDLGLDASEATAWAAASAPVRAAIPGFGPAVTLNAVARTRALVLPHRQRLAHELATAAP